MDSATGFIVERTYPVMVRSVLLHDGNLSRAVIEANYIHLSARGGGAVVSVSASYSKDLSSIPAGHQHFFSIPSVMKKRPAKAHL